MNQQAGQMIGKTIKVKSHRFIFTSIGVDVSNGRRGIFLYYPFTKRHSFKQYRLIKFLYDTKTKPTKN